MPYLDHDGRIALLRNAIELAASCDHPCLARLRNVIESPVGPILVYDRAPGELLGSDGVGARFAELPADRLLKVLDELIDVHRTLAESGWVAGDLYDQCLLVDLATDRLTLIDLDSYHRGPYENSMGRMFGSSRYMAPEEFELGATIHQRTTVFTLGRISWHFSTRRAGHPDQFCGSPALASVLERATRPDPRDRFASVEDFALAWRAARHRQS